MINQTKQILEESLKKLMLQKPLDKITIRDLTEDCNISRMAFYYHFKDIYDLVEWSCLEDATRALAGKKTYSTWTEGLLQIFEVVYENKPFIMNAYRCISREQIENFLFQLTSDLIMGVVKEQEQAANTTISDKDKRFIADFYKYSFVGIMLDWIKQGMKEDYEEIARMIAITLNTSSLFSISPNALSATRSFKLSDRHCGLPDVTLAYTPGMSWAIEVTSCAIEREPIAPCVDATNALRFNTARRF